LPKKKKKKKKKKMEAKRAAVLSELLDTEKTYVQGLQTLTRVFANPIRLTPKAFLIKKSTNQSNLEKTSTQRLLPPEDTNSMFSNVDTLLTFHQELVKILQERILPAPETDSPGTQTSPGDTVDTCIGDVFVARAPFLRMYSTYLNNYQAALTTLRRCEDQNADFKTFLETAHKEPSLNGLNIVAFLLLPIQRIPRCVPPFLIPFSFLFFFLFF